MPNELIEIYNSLSEEKKREVFAFAAFLKNYDERAESEDDILKKTQNAFWELREYAKKNLPEMSMEEIDAEIAAARAERKAKKKFLDAFYALREEAKQNGVSGMSLEKINEIISEVRSEQMEIA